MRLIDADKLIERLKVLEWKIAKDTNAIELLECRFGNDMLSNVIDTINSQPTAFDKEKVIEDVFELLKSKRDSRYMKIPFDDLEIRKYKNELKRGGVNEVN